MIQYFGIIGSSLLITSTLSMADAYRRHRHISNTTLYYRQPQVDTIHIIPMGKLGGIIGPRRI